MPVWIKLHTLEAIQEMVKRGEVKVTLAGYSSLKEKAGTLLFYDMSKPLGQILKRIEVYEVPERNEIYYIAKDTDGFYYSPWMIEHVFNSLEIMLITLEDAIEGYIE